MKYKTLAVATGFLLAASLSLQPVPVQAGAAYGPVKNNDTLWDIASRRRPSYDISVPQMMAAIRAQNPHAFVAGDINHLRKGIYLKIPVLPEVSQSAGKQASQASLQAEISQLRTQLKEEQTHSVQLAEQLKQIQAAPPASTTEAPSDATKTTNAGDQEQVAKLQSDMMVKLQTELAELKQQVKAKDARIAELQAASEQVAALPNTSNDPAATSPEQTQQADAAMKAELAELKQLLEQRDTHIQNLQASLREASISIKRQYAESQELHARIQKLEPGSNLAEPQPPVEPGANPAPSLTLAGVEPAQPEPTPAFADQVAKPAPAAEPSNTGNGQPVSLQNMLDQKITGTGLGNQDGKLPAPSRVSLVVALVSLMFILALLWRSLSQRRALNQEEARLRAELEV